jgi:opacity protein-like surface antigen
VRTFLVCVVMVALCAVGAQAQVKAEMQLNGELGVPVNPQAFTDGWSAAGFGGGVGFGIQVLPIVTVQANFNYSRVGLDEDGIKQQLLAFGFSQSDLANLSLDGGAINIMYVSGGAKVFLMEQGPARPYVVGGMGYYRLSESDLDVSDGSQTTTLTFDSENAFGVNGGAGVDFAIGSKVDVFAEGQYVVGFTSGQSTGHVPVRVGLLFRMGQ